MFTEQLNFLIRLCDAVSGYLYGILKVSLGYPKGILGIPKGIPGIPKGIPPKMKNECSEIVFSILTTNVEDKVYRWRQKYSSPVGT